MRNNLFKKLIPGVVLAALCLSFLPIQVPVVHAQYGSQSSADQALRDQPATSNTDYGKTDFFNYAPAYSNSEGSTGPSTGSSGFNSGSKTPAEVDGCGLGNGLQLSVCVTNIIYVFTVGIGSAFAYVAAFFFDLAIQLSLQSTAYALDFISTGWTLARDLANMAFLFILIYIALKVMLNAQDRTTSSMLIGVIIVALLVNFSFFFTRVVIDAGNLLSVQFYNAIQAPMIGTTAANSSASSASNFSVFGFGPSTFAASASGGQTKDLTAGIMGMMQLQSLFSTAGWQKFADSNNAGFLTGFITLTFLYVAAAVLYWGLIVIFITVGVKFLMRIMVLWFLIIASPLAFIAYAVPNGSVEGLFKKWLTALVNHAFYPVGFMFVFFILTIFSNQLGGANLINSIFSGVTNQTGTSFIQTMAVAIANTAIRLGFVLGVMYIGLQASEYLSVWGGQAATRAGSWAGGRFIGTAAGSFGWVGRNSVGRFSNALAGGLKNTVDTANQTGVNRRLWQGVNLLARPVLQRGASATFDARNAPGASLLKKSLDKSMGVPIETGAAAIKGYKEGIKDAADERVKEKKARAAEIRDASNKQAVDRIGRGTGSADDENRVRNMNKREQEKLSTAQVLKVAHLLNETQLKNELDGDKHTDEDKEKIKNIAEPIIKAQKEVTENLRKASNALRTAATTTVNAHTTRGSQITLADITAMHTDVNAQKAAIRTFIAANPALNHGERNADLTQLHSMTNSLSELARQVAKIQAVGGRSAGVHHVT